MPLIFFVVRSILTEDFRSEEFTIMRKCALCFSLFVTIFSFFLFSQEVRKSVLTEGWYPEDPERLSRLLDSFLQTAAKGISPPQSNIIALIAPHAGYRWSGQVAAYAYSLVQNKDYKTAVIIAPSHRHGFNGCSIYPRGGYQTPFGVAQIDEALASELSKDSGFGFVREAHRMEHAVEIQIPFVQKTLPQAKIVPIIMGYQTKRTIHRLANSLKKVLPSKKALVIASTDLSHMLSKKKANAVDNTTISLIKNFKTADLIRKCERGENIMCGGGPVAATLLYAKNSARVDILRYADSSQFGSPESEVVGYLAAAFIENQSKDEFILTEEEKKELLRLAYSTIKMFVQENKMPDYHTENALFLQKRGAFVTLAKNGQLRGCIGFTEPYLPLYQTVMQAAVYAACQDNRFLPVSPDEIDDLRVEISVLTPLRKIKTPSLLSVGKHGLVISKNGKKGLLLPQVAVENNWSRETFLEQTCLKAGLSRNAWKTGADLFVFEAIVFH
jgi:hypothetical protein